MNICIRSDGGSQIGMGHIMRTMVIAHELKKKHNVFFLCRVDSPLTNKYKPGIDILRRNGFEVKYIRENAVKDEIYKINADCIITDSYDVDEEYFNIIKKKFKISGCFDDEKCCEYFNVDFLINQNSYATTLNYKVNNDTNLMLGTEFVILRDEFRNIKYTKQIKPNIEDIMITVGGSDDNNLTEKIINHLKEFNYNLHVVIGSGFNKIEELKKYSSSKIKLYFNANMSKLMKICDICISSCGTTIFELARMGVPSIGIVVAENQVLAAETMDRLGIIKFSEIENLKSAINMLSYDKRIMLSKSASELVDGNGIYRIIKLIEERFNL
ncbi:UDP-2,4-diacetamido-2,4,6-trideoxy-beta-L-altropyranose hydrolase [Clostridium niameyense]|uniref:UDP-2,4-diacetamido-2,4, 6-trideoxy-beta-L-altropyranose hydrolase n=1 Tax=Clostridium niameyense TaxID=1622073 RepID=UPI00067ED1DD|nr:UDP-2,4-diacetamido-2,4,6-trideoxy-beta-L-altropyranose hydrolase [Clostridium niameyense]